MPFRFNPFTDRLDLVESSSSPTGDVQFIAGNSGGNVPPNGSGVINLLGSGLVTVSGNIGTNTLTINSTTSAFPITPYVVGPVGQAGYQTIQSAINAANTAGGGMVWVQPGTYTENLTLFSGIQLSGPSEQNSTIVGVHTPPSSGTLNLNRLTFQSATDIFSSIAAGTTAIIMEDCSVNVTNGYTFNLPNWTASGSVAVFNIGNFGTNDGFFNNTGGCQFYAFAAGIGNGTTNSLTISGTSIFANQIIVGCPVNLVTGASLSSYGSSYTQTLTLSNNSTASLNGDSFSTGATPSITMSSSGALSLSHVTINSSNNPAISGAGAGTITYADLIFLNNTSFAGTLTLSAANWRPYATAGNTSTAIRGTSGYDSNFFSVTNGFVSASGTGLGQTITGNSGGPISPTAGNWNLVGTSTNGINVVGSGSTLTAAMQSPYADGDFTFQSTVSGATRTLTVQNTSNTASSQASLLLSVAGATAGDAWLQMGIGSINSYSLGPDNSDNDNLKLTYSASGTVSPSSGTEVFRYDLTQLPSFIFGAGTPLFSPTALLGLISSVAGNNTSMEIQNTNAAASSGAVLALRVNGAAAGNPQITYDIFGVANSNWNHGILNSANDAWILNNGTGDLSAGNQVMISQLTGETNWPLQPAFLAYLTSTAANATGNGTLYVVAGYTEIYDQNSDFNAATGVYTAPVTGRHNFNSIIDLGDITVAFTQCLKSLVTSNRTYQLEQSNPFTSGDGAFWRTTHGMDADMDAGDTAYIDVSVSGGTQTVDVRSGGASSILTSFAGKLFA